MLFAPRLATYKNFPDGCTATEIGFFPVAKGDPEVTVRAPVPLSMAIPDTVLALKFAAYRKCPEGSIARASGALSTAKGEPGTVPKFPIPEATEWPNTNARLPLPA